MINGNLIIAFFVMQYGLFFLKMLKKDNRIVMQDKNDRIEFLRSKHNKTLEEQKEFIKLKYNQVEPAKFKLLPFLWSSVLQIGMFMLIWLPLEKSGLKPPFFLTLLISMIVVAILNRILIKFKLQRQDGLDTLFRR